MGRENDLSFETWLNLAQLVRDFGPTIVLELGRGFGNSTAVFTELANRLDYRVVSVGYDSEHAWETVTAPTLRPVVGRRWFRPLTIVHADITRTDFRKVLAGEHRPLLFWDAHGDDVANAVISGVFSLLAPTNLVVIHDVFDVRAEPSARDLPHSGGPYASDFSEIEPLWQYLSKRDLTAQPSRFGLLAFTAT